MDLLAFKSLLLLLSFTGCSLGQIQTLDAVLGGNVTLKHTGETPPYTVILWTFTGDAQPFTVVTVFPTKETVHASYQGRVSVNRTNGYITLSPLKSEDSGEYTISIVGDQTTTEETRLRVLDPVSDVVITSKSLEAIEYNSTVVLNCSAKGSLLRFDWYNGSDLIVADSRMTFTKERTSSALTITGVLRTDGTRSFYCEASNSLQRSRSPPFNLTVSYGPDPVTISPQAVPKFISSSANFSLSCSAISSPPATFTWYHNQQIIDVVGPALTIKAIKDKGLAVQTENFTCVATNAKTLRAISSSAVSFAVMDNVSGVQITNLTSTLIAGNSSANLSCQATGGIVTTKAWLKDGKPLTASPRLVFSDDMSSLFINPVQKEDNGLYKCNLSNPVSFSEASYQMVVNYGPEQPTVTGKKKVEENQSVILTCSAPSVPPAVFTWKFNGTLTNFKTDTYTVEKPALKDSGMYTCEAYNPVTGKTTTTTHTLEVKAVGTLDNGLSDGAIAGIVVGILVAIGIAIGVTIYCRQKVPVASPY